MSQRAYVVQIANCVGENTTYLLKCRDIFDARDIAMTLIDLVGNEYLSYGWRCAKDLSAEELSRAEAETYDIARSVRAGGWEYLGDLIRPYIGLRLERGDSAGKPSHEVQADLQSPVDATDELRRLAAMLRNMSVLLRCPNEQRPIDEGTTLEAFTAEATAAAKGCGFAQPPVVLLPVELDGQRAQEIVRYAPDGQWVGQSLPARMPTAEYEQWRTRMTDHLGTWLAVVDARLGREPRTTRVDALATLESRRMTWQQARAEAEAHIDRNPFPGVNALARIVGCSQSTMSRAVRESPKLLAAKLRHESENKSVSDMAMPEGAMESTPQTREPDPADAAARSGDTVFARLVQAASAPQRAMLHRMPDADRQRLDDMTPDQQRELIASLYDPDAHELDESPRVRGRSR